MGTKHNNIHLGQGRAARPALEGEVSAPSIPPNEPLRNECEHFLDTIEKGTRPLSGGAEGLAVVRVLDAMSKSLKLRGQEVAVESV